MPDIRVLVLPDSHAQPRGQRGRNRVGYNRPAVDCMLHYASANGPYNRVVWLGDTADMRTVNRHIRNIRGEVEGGRIQADMDAGADLVSLVKGAASMAKGATTTCLLGNHEAWLYDYFKHHPEASEAFSWERTLKARGVDEVLPYRPGRIALRIGKLHFMHGYGRGGMSQVRRWLLDLGVNIVAGHIHRVHQESAPSAHGTRSAWSLGWLGDFDDAADYVDGAVAWQHAFGEAIIDERTGDFNFYTHNIIDGRLRGPDGRRYGRR